MQGKKERINSEIYSQTEDAVLKTASDAFGEVFLPYLGIMEKPERTAPTEMVHLEIKKMYEDFNFQRNQHI